MAEKDRDDQGRFREQVTKEDVLSYFKDEPMTATEIAHEFDISNRAALNKLEGLREEGKINRKDVGARAVIWWK